MYEQHWKLESNPFESGFDPRFFFQSETHQAALLKLKYLVENDKGAGLLVGATGLGKTFVLRQLAHELDSRHRPFVHIVYPKFTATELLADVAVRLGAEESAVRNHETGTDYTVRQIERQLRTFTQQDWHPIIVIDEAHVIEDLKVFESIRLLLNFQSTGQSNFTLILAGDRVLLSRVARIQPLDERLTVKSLLRPLTQSESANYVQHRLQSAGASDMMFDTAALSELFELSQGIPRKLNRLCDLALLVGYADGMESLTASQIASVSSELSSVTPD